MIFIQTLQVVMIMMMMMTVMTVIMMMVMMVMMMMMVVVIMALIMMMMMMAIKYTSSGYEQLLYIIEKAIYVYLPIYKHCSWRFSFGLYFTRSSVWS